MTFSQRNGLAPVKTELESQRISVELKNSLWTVFHEVILSDFDNYRSVYGTTYSDLARFCRELWVLFYKYPIDTLPMYADKYVPNEVGQIIRKRYFESDYLKILDFVDFCGTYSFKFQNDCNVMFRQEMSAYRFVGEVLVSINSEEEVVELETALQNNDVTISAKEHLKKALEYYGNREKPDYRNSVKEAISAVESVVKVLVDDRSATLGQALTKIEQSHGLHPALKKGFSSIYGYTSDAGGIRHALLDGDLKIDAAEARFMLVSCSAFVNYLIVKCR